MPQRPTTDTPPQVVDWALAERAAVRWVPPGPPVTLAEAHRVVAELSADAATATSHVARTTGLVVPAGAAVRVVDRAGWARANTASLRALLDPVLAEALERRTARAKERSRGPRLLTGLADGRTGGRAVLAAGAKVTATEVAALLAWLSSRVLGQYDVFSPTGGQLLLVAPNVVQVERELGVDPSDFRLWVALHEETHRVQFAVAPWLGDHLAARARGLSVDLLGSEDGTGPAERLASLARQLVPGRAGPGALGGRALGGRALGGRAVGGGALDGGGLVAALAGPAQQRALAEVTAVMSLLEGHADVVMDDAGPAVIPSVAHIRQRFSERRRTGRGASDRVLRRLLGLDAKLRQYTEGAAFVRAVVREVGHEGLNRVWAGPELLPRPEEISAPRDWVRRVHG